jgi:hypothetical protein
MKKLIGLLIATMIFSAVSFAQDSTDMTMHHHKDCIRMKKGKMMVMKSGQWWELSQDTTLNGTTVTTSGTVKKQDGSTIQLSEGEGVDMNGNMMAKKKGMKKSS